MRTRTNSMPWLMFLVFISPLVAFLIPLGFARYFSVSQLAALGIYAFDVVLLTLWLPATSIVAATVGPLLVGLSQQWLLAWGAPLLLTLAAMRCWKGAGREARRGAVLIMVFGASTLVFGLSFADTPPNVRSIVLALVSASLTGVVAALRGVKEHHIRLLLAAVGTSLSVAALSSSALRIDRTTAVFGENANGVGFFSAVGLVAGITLIRERSLGRRSVGIIAVVVCAAGLVTSGSRGALIASLVGIAAVIFRKVIAGGRPATAIAGSLIVVGLLFTVVGPITHRFMDLAGRDEELAEYSLDLRDTAIVLGLQEGLSHPVFGIGLGRFAEVSQDGSSSALGSSAHNVYAGLFAEAGLIPLLVLVGIGYRALIKARRFSSSALLPLVVVVLVNGMALQWWGQSRTGPIALLVLGAALGLGTTSRSADYQMQVKSSAAQPAAAPGHSDG